MKKAIAVLLALVLASVGFSQHPASEKEVKCLKEAFRLLYIEASYMPILGKVRRDIYTALISRGYSFCEALGLITKLQEAEKKP